MANDNEYVYRALEDWRLDHPQMADVPLGQLGTHDLSQILERAQVKKLRFQEETRMLCNSIMS
jgi:hypothetical protein